MNSGRSGEKPSSVQGQGSVGSQTSQSQSKLTGSCTTRRAYSGMCGLTFSPLRTAVRTRQPSCSASSGSRSSQTPFSPRVRGQAVWSQPLKSPIRLTPSAAGAHSR